MTHIITKTLLNILAFNPSLHPSLNPSFGLIGIGTSTEKVLPFAGPNNRVQRSETELIPQKQNESAR
jgi:hypothetical protein